MAFAKLPPSLPIQGHAPAAQYKTNYTEEPWKNPASTRGRTLPDIGKRQVQQTSERSRKRKYTFTDQIDQLIREIYLNRGAGKTKFSTKGLEMKVGIPHWALKKRALELGLARTKELPGASRNWRFCPAMPG